MGSNADQFIDDKYYVICRQAFGNALESSISRDYAVCNHKISIRFIECSQKQPLICPNCRSQKSDINFYTAIDHFS